MSRLSVVKEKYPKVNWKTWEKADPSKNFKYLDWIGKNKTFFRTPAAAKNLLINFEKHLSKLENKDITRWEPAKLSAKLAEFGKTNSEKKNEGAELIGELDGAKIYCIKTYEAAKKYGAGTKWCITNLATWKNYNDEYHIFFVIKDKLKICMICKHTGVFADNIWTTDDTSHNVKTQFHSEIAQWYGIDLKKINNLFVKYKEICVKYLEKNPHQTKKLLDIYNKLTVNKSGLNSEELKFLEDSAVMKELIILAKNKGVSVNLIENLVLKHKDAKSVLSVMRAVYASNPSLNPELYNNGYRTCLRFFDDCLVQANFDVKKIIDLFNKNLGARRNMIQLYNQYK